MVNFKPPSSSLYYIGGLFTVILLLVTVGILVDRYYLTQSKDQARRLGVSFSIKASQGFGLDWQENYLALLEDLGFRDLRLMSYWDLIEKSPDQYDFADLDWQFEQAEKFGAKIDLAIGLRQPRWPECHQPDWVSSLDYDQRDQKLDQFISRVVERYQNNPALSAYQLENEYSNKHFGDCDYDRSNTRLQAEYDLVKSIDPEHPVRINVSNQSGIPIRKPIGDQVGFSIYFQAHFDLFGRTNSWQFILPSYWHTIRAGLVGLVDRREVFVHEFQLEPWGDKPISEMTIEQQLGYIDSDEVGSRLRYLGKTGIKEAYLWGGEWWYYLKTRGEDSVWEAFRAIIINDNGSQTQD
ncbi:hypothetical protein H6792_00400 [Candidatus Nomurabacteria bacterium]|nr:hypothetical protein [Candidatus Nomurabacteria bacterium]